jgi:hypothetical protein
MSKHCPKYDIYFLSEIGDPKIENVEKPYQNNYVPEI